MLDPTEEVLLELLDGDLADQVLQIILCADLVLRPEVPIGEVQD